MLSCVMSASYEAVLFVECVSDHLRWLHVASKGMIYMGRELDGREMNLAGLNLLLACAGGDPRGEWVY